MLSQTQGPEMIGESPSRSRYHVYQLRQWLEALHAAGDGAWANVREESSEMLVVGEVIDPNPVARITDETTDNKIVGIFESHGATKIVIQLGRRIHKTLKADTTNRRHIQMDATMTKKELGRL